MESEDQELLEQPVETDAGWLASLGRTLRSRAYELLRDDALVLHARIGHHAAFDTLFARHRDRLYAMALHSLGDERQAGAALCDMVVSAYRDLGSPEAERTPGTWLYLHGFRAVFKRMRLPTGRYTIERRAAGRQDLHGEERA